MVLKVYRYKHLSSESNTIMSGWLHAMRLAQIQPHLDQGSKVYGEEKWLDDNNVQVWSHSDESRIVTGSSIEELISIIKHLALFRRYETSAEPGASILSILLVLIR